jgi:predicted regulator of Ras-like GTPase activity (Roadblock/LC7/MglB family)
MTMENTDLPAGLVEQARHSISAFLREIVGVTAVVIASLDGYDLVSAFKSGADASRIAAMGSSISALGTVVAAESGMGETKSVIITAESGFAVVQGARHGDLHLVINVMADSEAILAQVLLRAASVAKELSVVTEPHNVTTFALA